MIDGFGRSGLLEKGIRSGDAGDGIGGSERGNELARGGNFRSDRGMAGGGNGARSGAFATVARSRWAGDRGCQTLLDDEGARRDEGGELGIAKLPEQAEDIAIDRLLEE